uniref:Protein phosphatase 1, regulatory (Inhibitor) subunit 14A n=1 Tax=Callorhinchus milii TaxID=7868 RepID=V9LJY3_CALMI
MAAYRMGKKGSGGFSALGKGGGSGGSGGSGAAPRRQARVTVKYDRRGLQHRLDVEKWIEDSVCQLYREQEDEMPEEVNIDDLLELETDQERTNQLQILFASCNRTTDVFIGELVTKLEGLHKAKTMQRVGQEVRQ